MSKRNIEKHILMNKAEAQDLQKKAKRACLSEGGLIRLLLKGYEPREKPDERFYDVMRELSAIGNNINQLAAKANTLGFVDAPQLKKEAERKVCMVPDDLELSPIAQAYVRARGCDRVSSFGDFAALSDECDASVAKFLVKEVSDGIIAPSYTDEALEILKAKRRGNYLIIKMDPDYQPEEMETKQVFGIKFEQKRNDAKLTMSLFDDMPTKVKDIPEIAKIDLLISLITLKYTQSNSVCYASGGQTIGVGAGQQSRIHCTRLAGNKADNLWLRHNEKVLNLPFIDGLRKCEADNAIDLYISDEYEDLLKDGVWQRYFTTCPEPFTAEEKKAWHEKMTNVALGSDAFFPFEDNIERAARSGVKYIAQPGGSVRDGAVIECCDGFGMAMAMTGIRLFHH